MTKHIDERVSPYDVAGMQRAIKNASERAKEKINYQERPRNVSPYDLSGMKKVIDNVGKYKSEERKFDPKKSSLFRQ